MACRLPIPKSDIISSDGSAPARDRPGGRRDRLLHRRRAKAPRVAVGDQPADSAARGRAEREHFSANRAEGAHYTGGRVAGAAEPSRVRRHQGDGHRHRRQPAGAERHDSAGGRHDGVHVRVSDAAAGVSAPAFARRSEAHHRDRRSDCCRRFGAARPTSGSSRCR